MLLKAVLFAIILNLLSSTVDSSTVILCKPDAEESFSYHGLYNGPSFWGVNASTCNGDQQSPVAIDTEKAEPDDSLGQLKLNNYDVPVKRFTVLNNGHTVQVTLDDGVSRTIEVEDKIFDLKNLHFHWGSRYYQGSEHSLDGVHYILEAHFVHKAADDSIAVVAVLFENERENNPGFEPIAHILPKILFKNDTISSKKYLDLNSLLPNNPSSFYRYIGSLTIPKCDENVIWSVLQGVQGIGVKQMRKLQKLYSVTKEEQQDECKITDNFRPLQPLNGRTIYKSQ